MKLLLTLLTAATAALAQTTVTGPLNVPTGGTFSGRIIITAPNSLTYEGETYVGWQRTITITNGALNIALIPNIGSTPPATAYRVQYFPTSGTGWSEFWYVPVSGTPLKVHQVRADVAPTSNMILRLDELEPGTIAGQCLKWNGTAWAPAANCGGGGSSGPVEFVWKTPLTHVEIPNPFGTEDVDVFCSDTGGGVHVGLLKVATSAPYLITVDYNFGIVGSCKISSGPSYGVKFTNQTLVSIQPEEHRLVGVKSSFCRDESGVRQHPGIGRDSYLIGGVEFIGVRNYFVFPNTGRCAVIGAH